MWPDRRLIELLQIEHPLVLAPMAGIGTVELAASACAAGGLGSIGCAGMQPELVAKTIQALRGLTRKPINVNFFCHVQAKADAEREQAWRDRLSPYYCELGIHSELPHPRVDVAPFDDTMCRVVEDTKPEVVSFHFDLPDSALLDRVKAADCRVMASATTVAEALWLEARGVDTSSHRVMKPAVIGGYSLRRTLTVRALRNRGHWRWQEKCLPRRSRSIGGGSNRAIQAAQPRWH